MKINKEKIGNQRIFREIKHLMTNLINQRKLNEYKEEK